MKRLRNLYQSKTGRAQMRQINVIALCLLGTGCVVLNPTQFTSPGHEASQALSRLSDYRAKDTVTAKSDATKDAERPAFTLDKCIEAALQNNPRISATHWDAETAIVQKAIFSSKRWPTIHLSGSYFHYEDNQRVHPPTQPGQLQYYTKDLVVADVVLRMPLYAGGRIVNEIHAADLLARAAAHTLARTQEEIIFNVASTFYAILAQAHVIRSLEFSQKAMSQHLEQVQHLVVLQKAAKVDALRTEVRVADLEHQLLQERNTHAIYHRVLANLMGIEADESAAISIIGELDSPRVEVNEKVDDLIRYAYGQRSDYAAALLALEGQAERVKIARGAQAPEVNLEAAYGGRWGIAGSADAAASGSLAGNIDANGNSTLTHTSSLWGGRSIATTWGSQGFVSSRYTRSEVDRAGAFEDVGRVGVTFSLPLFEGGRLKNQVVKERVRLNAAEQRLRKLEQQIRLEVESALLNTTYAKERVHVMQKSVTEAEESMRIERQKYVLAKGAITDVLDAQAAFLNAQTNLYRALAECKIARAQLHLAIGDMKADKTVYAAQKTGL